MTYAPNGMLKLPLYAGVSYLFFIIYGSLVPFDFHRVDWSVAWQAFSQIRYLDLTIASRADWIANTLLYIPLTFIWLSVFKKSERPSAKIGASFGTSLMIFAASIALSVCIEFAQLFFPPRTVSVNDLIAEAIGSAAGVLLWHMLGVQMTMWLAALCDKGNAAIAAAISLYVLTYLIFSFFPFDFVISLNELTDRWTNGHDSFFISSGAYGNPLRGLFHLLLEILLALPLGAAIAHFMLRRSPSFAVALLMGGLLGLTIEGVQLFLHSGISQGASVLTRAIGTVLGAIIYKNFSALYTVRARSILPKLRRFIPAFIVIYLIILIGIQNWKASTSLDWSSGLERLSKVHFLPFYYHYFTSETGALISLCLTAIAYAPVGVFIFYGLKAGRQYGISISAITATVLAAAFEFIKLFHSSLHPDPTNIFIAAVAAVIAYRFSKWINMLYVAPAFIEPRYDQSEKDSSTSIIEPGKVSALLKSPSRIGEKLLSVIFGCIALATIFYYPIGNLWLGIGVAAYSLLLYYKPNAWLLVVPALLPILDFAPWTGRFFFDELDCVLAATIAIAYWHMPSQKLLYRFRTSAFLIFSLFILSFNYAIVICLPPLSLPDLNSFNNYYSSYNVLRVGKGLFWALLMLPLIKYAFTFNLPGTYRLFSLGMTTGVGAAAIAVMWERAAFPGLLNFNSGYRVVGMFSGMHVGGTYIEAYLVMAMPFVGWWIWASRQWRSRLFGTTILVVGLYMMMVTYARGGYMALAFGMALLVTGLLLQTRISFAQVRTAGGVLLLLLSFVGGVWLLAQGSHINNRFSTSKQDLYTRISLWQDALNMMDDDATSKLFGMGLGQYPEIYFWRSNIDARPATYIFKQEAGNTYLALGAGVAIYFEQLVNLHPDQQYQLRFSARSSSDKGELRFPICEKWMLYSSNCITQTEKIGNTHGQWKEFNINIRPTKFPAHRWYSYRTQKFSVYNPVIGSVAEIDNISLLSSDGKDLLRNGDFINRMDHWFFSTDNHLPWHIENTWVQIYFEQGAVGLCLFFILVTYAGITMAKRYRDNTFPLPALAASLASFLALGTLNSIFDFPRLMFLFYLLIASVLLEKQDDLKIPRRRKRHAD